MSSLIGSSWLAPRLLQPINGCSAEDDALFRSFEYPNLPTLLEKIATKTGKGGFYQLASHGMNGAFQLDSAWHHGWETVAALIATTKATTR
ncbi:hypothetical protein ACIP6P_30585 [Streptomyces sp. NPDC088729]|uniref:hypothetical protein n=1 Tax=Streptomyces sp. NPDC088729 TaxID=3365876 RepID=UPI00380D9C7E